VPYLRAPFFVWLGRPWADSAKQAHHEQKVEAPALFPPTFLYTQSWEDPEPDMKVGGGLDVLTNSGYKVLFQRYDCLNQCGDFELAAITVRKACRDGGTLSLT
jgi:hypothetical protein